MSRMIPLALFPLIFVTGCCFSGSVSHSFDHSRLPGSGVEICECGRVHHAKRPLLKRRQTVLPMATRPLFPGDRWGQAADLSAPVSTRTAQVLPTQFPVQQASWSGATWSGPDGCGECGEVINGCHMPSCSQPVPSCSGPVPSCSQPVWINSGCHQPASCSQPVMTDECECTDVPPVTCSHPVTCNAPTPVPAPAPPAPVPPAAAPRRPVPPGCAVPADPQCDAPAGQPAPEVDFLPPVEEPPAAAPPAELGGVPMPNDMIDPISWEQIPTLPPLP